MKKIKIPVASAIKRSSLLTVATWFVGLIPFVQATAPGHDASGGELSQAVVAYGYLRWDYLDFNELSKSSADLSAVRNIKALDETLESLRCDIPMRMAGPHRATILPPSPINQWISFPRPGGRGSRENGWLFVTQPSGVAPQRILVVFSTAAPEHTTIFWLEESNGRYSAKLLYDSSKKGTVANETTTIGAVTALRFENSEDLLLKDWGEPGIGSPEAIKARRVFRLALSDGKVTLFEPGKLQPQH